MSGLSYFTIRLQHFFADLNSVQIQPWSKKFEKMKIQVKIKSEKLKNYSFLMTKIAPFFHELSPNPILILTLRSSLQFGSNPNSTKFVIDRIQSNLSPVQCLSLIP